jgi:hypothetical protein
MLLERILLLFFKPDYSLPPLEERSPLLFLKVRLKLRIMRWYLEHADQGFLAIIHFFLVNIILDRYY